MQYNLSFLICYTNCKLAFSLTNHIHQLLVPQLDKLNTDLIMKINPINSTPMTLVIQ